MKKVLLMIMLVMCMSGFSTNTKTPHLLTSSNHRDCDDDEDDEGEDDHDDDDDDDDTPALPINGYVGVLLIIGCIFIFNSVSNKKE
jgi:hypothetical protein